LLRFNVLLWLGTASVALAAEPGTVARFRVEARRLPVGATPVHASLEGLPLDPPGGGELALFEIAGDEARLTPSQIEPGVVPRLWWVLDGATTAGGTRRYELRRLVTPPDAPAHEDAVSLEDDGASLTLGVRGTPTVAYRYAPLEAPPGQSKLYRRGGFLHPLWSPGGAVLTRVQPPDHYHHVGVWNPWTHTEYDGRKLDFWNLDEAQGTVRFAAFLSRVSGDVYAGFRSLHEHVDLTAPDPDGRLVVLSEVWDVRVWSPGDAKGPRIVDLTSTLSAATDRPLTIEAYRYQGFGFRATAEWNDANTHLLTSEGRDKSDGNATRARWCDVRGPTAAGTSGVLFMTSPANRDYPELLRIWPVGANGGVENVFFNFNPAQERDWVLEPGRVHSLRYRMLVYDGEISPEAAEGYWRDFAEPPRVVRE